MTMNFETNNPPYYTLEEALENTFSQNSGCLLTMGIATPGYSSAVLCYFGKFYVFDPHSRTEAGMPAPNGLAVLTVHKNLEALCLFLRHLPASVEQTKNIPFEVAEVSVVIDNTGVVESDFDGFSYVSDGELTCRL